MSPRESGPPPRGIGPPPRGIGAPGAGLACLCFAVAAACWVLAPERARELGWLAALSGATLWLNGWAADRARGGARDWPGLLAMWAVFVLSCFAVYLQRDRVSETALAWTDEIGLTRPELVVTAEGDLAVTRGLDGTFVIAGAVNGTPARFVFDTGATAVVLTAETADRMGIPRDKLNYRVSVSTANGRGLAAPILIDSLRIGSITATRLPALVSKPGVLHENLLGQTFLDRLGGYEVRGRKLILRAG